MSNIIVGGVFVIAGVLISIVGQVVYDAWLNRRRMTVAVEEVRAVIGRTTTYFRLRRLGETKATLASGMVPVTGWTYCDPKGEAAYLVLCFILTMQNPSRSDDAVSSTEVEVSWGGKVLSSTREAYADGRRLYGTPVGAHAFHAVAFDFAIPARALPFLSDPSAKDDVACTLRVRTIRCQEFILTRPLHPTLVAGEVGAAILPQPGLPDYYPGTTKETSMSEDTSIAVSST
jgi:hypothetical protein